VLIYHFEYGLKNFDNPRKKIKENEYARFRSILDDIESVFQIDKDYLSPEATKFIEDSRRATTDASARERRAKYIIQQLING